jgi:secreted trypsin-like serine protease
MLKPSYWKSWARFTASSFALLSLAGAQVAFAAPLKTEFSPIEMQRFGGRIVGGTVAPKGAYPFMVSLETLGGFHFCGGTLISRTKILTAAHCSNLVTAQARIGTNLLTQGRLVRVTTQEAHPRFDAATFDYDVAVWTLEQPVTLSSTVGIMKLPSACKELDCGITNPGTRLLTTGWGTLSEGGASPNDLRQVVVPVLSNQVCNRPVSYNGTITKRMICAGLLDGGKDSCQGDSGGPLFRYFRTDKRGVQAGIVSFGIGCARPNKPGVYTRITNPAIRDFIRSKAGV